MTKCSSSGDYKTSQIKTEQRNRQQSHCCSTAGDKTLCAARGTLCGLSADNLKEEHTPRNESFVGESLTITANLRTKSQELLRISLDLNSLCQLLLSSHNTTHSCLSFLISPTHHFFQNTEAPPPSPHCEGNNGECLN